MKNYPINPIVNFIEVKPHKGLTNMSLDISFSQNGILKHAPNGLIYIARRINDNHTHGILIDPIYVENVITREFVFVHELYQDNYEQLKE